jgi:heme-degrading monooxygenase HmoA
MDHPKLVLLVKFKSALPEDEVKRIADSRIEEFRALRGLKQKYYLQDAQSGEYAGLYLWESVETFDEYRNSELRASIAAAYQAVGEPRVEVFKVWMPLRVDMF